MPWGWPFPSLQKPRLLKRKAKTHVPPGELSRETRPLPCGPEHRQWKMPPDPEPEDPVMPPTKLHNCGQASSVIFEMMTHGGLDLQKVGGNREK